MQDVRHVPKTSDWEVMKPESDEAMGDKVVKVGESLGDAHKAKRQLKRLSLKCYVHTTHSDRGRQWLPRSCLAHMKSPTRRTAAPRRREQAGDELLLSVRKYTFQTMIQ